MFHNVNHLSLQGENGLDMFVNNQSSLQVDIQAFSEHCIDTTKFYVHQKAIEILRRNYTGQTLLHWNSSTEQALNIYKPGGTGILALGSMASRLEPDGKGNDSLGRWCYIHLRRHNLPPLTIVSAYQVCPRPTNILGNTAYHQQIRLLNSQGRHNTHPRKAFVEDFSKFIESLLRQDHDIIVGGDFNESFQDRHSGILHVATSNNLVDPFTQRFPHLSEFGTHACGRRRIDIVLVTPRLLHSIKLIGYAPFDYSTPSDHRPLIIEFHTASLFGNTSIDVLMPNNRDVKSNDKASVQKFIDIMFEEVTKRKGFDLLDRLQDDSATTQLVEQVDRILGESGDIAESKCKHRRPEFYSRTIVQHRVRVSILRGHLNALKSGRDRSPQLRRKMQRAGIDVILPATIRLTRMALDHAKIRLQTTSKNSMTVRHSEFDSRLNNVASDTLDQQSRKALRAIQKVEANRNTYNILKAMRASSGIIDKLDRVEIPATWPPPGQQITSLDQLEDPKTSTQWRLITNPSEVEYYLMLRNRLHFGQAEGTPFTVPPLQDDLDWEARSYAAEAILQGQYSTSIDTSQCQELLQACKAQATLDTIPQELTTEEFRGKIIAWRETTTTSPSGRHLGRYKALFRDGLPQLEDANETTFATKQDKLTKLILAVINYCIRNTYVLDRWRTIVNVMIFKESGNFKIHRLRVIHIYEADFNLILAVKWRQLLHSATDQNLINNGQYGGRPGCEAQSLTLLEELKYDLAYLTRRTLFNFDNDATSCYDRIIVPLASVINRKYGMHRNIVAVHARTLQQAKFHLKTSAGISEIHYTHCASFPIHGTGQGSGNSPCIWLFISSTLFDVHGSRAHGATFVSPDGSQRVHLSMVGFVDDSTGSLNDFQPSTQASLQVLFQRMAHDAQLWNDLLYCSGGKLELPKCSFHVLHFDFNPNGQPQPTLEKFDNTVHIRDSETNRLIPIPAKRAFETHKTLGHTKAPSTDVSKEIESLKHKSERLALLLATSPITRRGAMLAYLTVFIPSIQYTLPQSFYPKKILEHAQSSSIGHIIAKCGYNRNTARDLIYAPTYYAGGGFLPWYLLQGEGQTQQFIKHWRTDTIVSSTLRVALHWAQWQSGHHAPILEDTETPLPYLECRWVRSLRGFLSSINAKIHLDSTGMSLPERTHDIYIMKYASESGLFNTTDLAIINYCRLFLHVTTVSELFDAEGKHIMTDVFECRREPWFNPTTYVTLQRRPSAHQIRTKWQRLCREWSTSDGTIALSMHLGKWTRSGDQLRRRRQTYQPHASPNILYHWHDGTYWEYHPTQPGSNRYSPTTRSEWIPTVACTPIKAWVYSDNTIATKPPRDRLLSRSHSRPATSFEIYVSNLLPWEQSLLQGVQLHYSPYETRQHIHHCGEDITLLLVSDGSQRGSHISFGWVFGTASGLIFAEHSGHGYGTATSHRAEAWGMLSATAFLHHLLGYTAGVNRDFPLHAQQVTFCSDNAGLIQRMTQRKKYTTNYPNATLSPDWELVEQIHVTANSIPASISYEWVRGHQDDCSQELTTSAHYNIRADELAGNVPINTHKLLATPWLLPVEKCRLVINDRSVHGHYKHSIRHAYMTPPLFAYLARRHGWSQQTLSDIDWEVFERAASNMSVSQVQLMKLVHDKLPTRYELAKSNPFQSKSCRHCEEDETFHHLINCSSRMSTKFRQDMYDRIDNYFCVTNTPMRFQQAFRMGLDHCCPLSSTQAQSNCPHADHHQQSIGWPHMLKGYWTKTWRKEYTSSCSLDSTPSSSNPVDYMAKLLRLLWTEQLRFWAEHQNYQHQSSSSSTRQLNDKLAQYQTRIRLLHEKKPQCLHGHRELYFHADVEAFLQNATGYQMKQYLHNYEQAIYNSIKSAQRIPLRSIFTFPGYTRTPVQRAIPRPRPPGHPPDNSTSHSSLMTRGNLLPHKHTRWKTITTAMTSIRNFFSPPS